MAHVADRTDAARSPRSVPGALSALVFGTVARVRRNRALHPQGIVLGGRFGADATPGMGASSLFSSPGSHEALVRISRGGGLPQALPDVRGCAVRVLDAYGEGRHQDLLLASSLAAPVGRHLLVAGRDFASAFYSSILPYDVGGRRVLIGARIEGPAGRRLGDVRSAAAGAGLVVHLMVASPLGEWRRAARVELDRLADDAHDIRFNPFTTGGGIRPIGTLMGVRDPAYRASQKETP